MSQIVLSFTSLLKILIQILLSPLSLLYGIVTIVRNVMFDWGILSSTTFDIPIVVVGNLSVGGTGKTPHIEYLIRLLNNNFTISTLSRGYKRKTKGFFLANQKSTSNDIGDEPLQYFKKFDKINVAVCEDRVTGVEQILKNNCDVDVILLDDAFQHRKLKAGLNILVTDFNNLFIDDYLMPSGRLREFRNGSQRADIIIVSKTPKRTTKEDCDRIISRIKPKHEQKIYFTNIRYQQPIAFNSLSQNITLSKKSETTVLIVTGIANPNPLLTHLKSEYKTVDHLGFADHHNYSKTDIEKIIITFQKIKEANKIIITTEKDIMRLSLPEFGEAIKEMPIFYVPIEIGFNNADHQEEFDKKIFEYVTTNRGN
jgi:tetraacyldisaccharide 4'-kinase